MKRRRKIAAAKQNAQQTTQEERLNQLRIMVWAALTMTSFIVAFLISEALGATLILPFIFGGTAMIAVMLIEALLRGRVWIFEPGFRESFGHPEIAYRILMFCGVFLLVLESIFLIGSYSARF